MRKLGLLYLVAVVGALYLGTRIGDAWAGEGLALGSIRVSDAGTTNNWETGYLDGLATNGAFQLGLGVPVSIQCEAPGAYVATGCRGVDAGRGVKLLTDQMLPVVTQTGGTVIPVTVDGGSYSQGLVCIAPLVGQPAALCRIFPRSGGE